MQIEAQSHAGSTPTIVGSGNKHRFVHPHAVGEIELVTAKGRERVPYPNYDLYTQAVMDFDAAVAGKGRVAADGVDGIKSLAIALAVRDSARTGTRLRVNYGGF